MQSDFESTFHTLLRYVNRRLRSHFVYISVGIFTLFSIFFLYRVISVRPYVGARGIERDIANIADAVEKINKDCDILSVKDNEPGLIDFLTVQKFTGFQVGPLMLRSPSNWHGPYMDKNPTVDGFYYQIVKTMDGHFIVPGDEVGLPTGGTIQELGVDGDTMLTLHMQPGGALFFKDIVLAKKIL